MFTDIKMLQHKPLTMNWRTWKMEVYSRCNTYGDT